MTKRTHYVAPMPFKKRGSKRIEVEALYIGTLELARMIGKDNRTINRWIKKGRLPPRIQITTTLKGWDRAVIWAWIEKHRDPNGRTFSFGE